MAKTRSPDPAVVHYFAEPEQAVHKQYLALRSFLHDGDSAETVALKYGYTVSTIYTMAKRFKAQLQPCLDTGEDPFFQVRKPGRKKFDRDDELIETIVAFRKKQLSVPDIKILLDAQGYNVSEGFIYHICDENGFTRLPKRSKKQRQELMKKSGYANAMPAPASEMCPFTEEEEFSS